jgi:hypothetical protein
MANVVPVFLGILLSALVLLAAGRFPVRVTSRSRRPATAGLVLRCRLAIRYLLCRGTLVIETVRSASRNRYARIQRSVELVVLQRCRSSDADIRWQLAGGLWLFIGGLLLTGLIFSI